MTIPHDYAERVYAGVLGKMIGVYLGRPVEGWTYEQITAKYGEIDRYIPDPRGAPLVVTDDDLSGTFTFPRALPDHGYRRDLSPAEIGESWLNYTIEGRTIFWWGGLGTSSEHTAYLRLKHGISAPASGAATTNGKVISEQIGAQIFIDGWAMIAPGDPEFAVDLARRAASVSHDGEAIYGAQIVAALASQAFVESRLNTLLDTAVSLIPRDSVIYRLIDDIRGWHAAEPDWRQTRNLVAANYGYDKYRGPCHMVPNHGLIVHALLHGNDDFRRTLMIVTTAGWDTDCNAGNVGCLLGIKNGLAAIDASGEDWRKPVADRLYLATADGGRAITDAVTETFHVINTGLALAGRPSVAPADGARFHFSLPGSVQGFQADPGSELRVDNVVLPGNGDKRALAISFLSLSSDRATAVTTPTFTPLEAIAMPGYELHASPTLYPGQTVTARIGADRDNATGVDCRLILRVYDGDDALRTISGPQVDLASGTFETVTWTIPDTGGQPIAAVGLALVAGGETAGTVYLERLSWLGAPDVRLDRPIEGGTMWRRAWVNGVSQFEPRWPEPFRVVQNEGTGLVSQGTADWTDYRATAEITPYLMAAGGIGLRVQGLRRYYALLLANGGTARLVKAMDGTTTLAETEFDWTLFATYRLEIAAIGNRIQAWINDQLLFDVVDHDRPLPGGGVALVCHEGSFGSGGVRVQPVA